LAPYPNEPAWRVLAATARRLPEKPVVIHADGTTWTYRELWETACGFAGLLQRVGGVRKGDVVALASENSAELVAAMYGALVAGATIMPFSPMLADGEIAAQLAECGASVAVGSETVASALATLRASGMVPDLRHVVPLEEVRAAARAQRDVVVPPDIRGEDLARFAYTSGTAGPPKAAMFTHRGLIASAYQLAATAQADERSVVLALYPTWAKMLWVFRAGATSVEPSESDPDQLLYLVETYGVTHLGVRPFVLQELVRAQARIRRTISSVRFLESTGSGLAQSLSDEAARWFACPIRQGYRLIETNGAANRTPPHDVRPGSVGCPVPDTEEMIVDPESGTEVPPGETGELLIRGPQVTIGYWRTPEATADAILPGGWLRTGDIARQDPDGHVYIVDRAKELIKVLGRQVAPAEIEAVLLEHPSVREAAVAPTRSAEADELPKAFVVLEAGCHATAEELILLVANRLAPYKVPWDIEFVPSLPRSARGKVLRRVLSEQTPD
jgi:acyl-CoA synthetase (AMP-forming)/AMP-acid ligase II